MSKFLSANQSGLVTLVSVALVICTYAGLEALNSKLAEVQVKTVKKTVQKSNAQSLDALYSVWSAPPAGNVPHLNPSANYEGILLSSVVDSNGSVKAEGTAAKTEPVISEAERFAKAFTLDAVTSSGAILNGSYYAGGEEVGISHCPGHPGLAPTLVVDSWKKVRLICGKSSTALEIQ